MTYKVVLEDGCYGRGEEPVISLHNSKEYAIKKARKSNRLKVISLGQTVAHWCAGPQGIVRDGRTTGAQAGKFVTY